MVVGTAEGNVKVSRNKALHMANEQGLDLVQLQIKDGIPVCKIMDYSKFVYEQKKRDRLNNKTKPQEVKEIRISDGIAENDIKFKAKNVSRILSDGDKVKVTITYKGRLMNFITRGKDKLKEFETHIDFEHIVEREPKIEGNRVYMIVSPKK